MSSAHLKVRSFGKRERFWKKLDRCFFDFLKRNQKFRSEETKTTGLPQSAKNARCKPLLSNQSLIDAERRGLGLSQKSGKPNFCFLQIKSNPFPNASQKYPEILNFPILSNVSKINSASFLYFALMPPQIFHPSRHQWRDELKIWVAWCQNPAKLSCSIYYFHIPDRKKKKNGGEFTTKK